MKYQRWKAKQCWNETTIVFKDNVNENTIKHFIDNYSLKNVWGVEIIFLPGFKKHYNVTEINRKNILNNVLTVEYESSFTPEIEILEFVYKTNKDIIKYINTEFEIVNKGRYGSIHIDENGTKYIEKEFEMN